MQSSILRPSVIAFIVGLWAMPAFGIDDSSRAASRKLVNDGVALYQRGEYAEALANFNAALVVANVPTVAVWAAQANEKLGHLVAALELYERALLMQPNELWNGDRQQLAMTQADRAAVELKGRIPTIRLSIAGMAASDVQVTIDGIAVPAALVSADRPVDPGEHVIVASGLGERVEERCTLKVAEKRIITLRLRAPTRTPTMGPTAIHGPIATNGQLSMPKAPLHQPQNMSMLALPKQQDDTQRTLGWLALGIGAVGAATGVVGGVLVATKHAALRDDGCNNTECRGTSFAASVDSYNTWRTVSTVGFVAGGIGAAAGLTLLLIGESQHASPQVGIALEPNYFSVRGRL